MTNEISSAKTLLNDTGISLLDAARLIRNALDALPKGVKSPFTPLQFCSKIIETGNRYIRVKEISFQKGFVLYLGTKQHLRTESISDIRYLGKRLLKESSQFAEMNFSELTLPMCEGWLSSTFSTPSQFNKGRAMLHGLFEFAFRREWCDKTPIRLIEKRKVVEKEIKPLALSDTKRLLETAKRPQNCDCLAAAGLLVLAGIRPREVRHLEWRDIDLEEDAITIRSQCSKTGGVRQVEICPALKSLLAKTKIVSDGLICPQNFNRKWKNIRDVSGFKDRWVQDVLRHTFASYHAKRFRDLPRLQLNMGHRDQSLLRSRYVNMSGISSTDARIFFHL